MRSAFLAFVFTMQAAGAADDSPQIFHDLMSVSSGREYVCAVDRVIGLKCWGNGKFLKNVPRDLHGPYLVSSYVDESCVVDEAGAKCWGDDFGKKYPFFPLANVEKVEVSSDFACALSQGKVRCWGDNSHGQLDVPINLENVVDFTTGPSGACAIQSKHLSCWGNERVGADLPFSAVSIHTDKFGFNIISTAKEAWSFDVNSGQNIRFFRKYANHPPLRAIGKDWVLSENGELYEAFPLHTKVSWAEELTPIRGITRDYSGACAYSSKLIKCHGGSFYPLFNPTKELNAYTQEGQLCAHDSQGMKCWGREKWDITSPQSLPLTNWSSKVISLAGIKSENCALLTDSLLCWGGALSAIHGLRNPSQVKMVQGEWGDGATLACVLENTQAVFCKGYYYSKEVEFYLPGLDGPYLMGASEKHLCVADRAGLTCFTFPKKGLAPSAYMKIPKLSGIKNLQMDESFGGVTVLTEDGLVSYNENGSSFWKKDELVSGVMGTGYPYQVVCGKWRTPGDLCRSFNFDRPGAPVEQPKGVISPSDFSIRSRLGEIRFCAKDEEKLKCWSYSSDHASALLEQTVY